MVEVIIDCEAAIGRGMGRGAYMHMEEANIRPILTDIADIKAAAEAYIAGTLEDHQERLH